MSRPCACVTGVVDVPLLAGRGFSTETDRRKPWYRQLRWSVLSAYLLVIPTCFVIARASGMNGWQEFWLTGMGILVVLSIVGGNNG